MESRRDFIKKMGIITGVALIGGAVIGNLGKIPMKKEESLEKGKSSTVILTPITGAAAGGGYFNLGYGPLMLSGAIVDILKEKGL